LLIILRNEEALMEFRWLIFLTLWTMLSGPILARPVAAQEHSTQKAAKAPANSQLKR
jgi:hypothetical protein